jgi:hypothetical protein
MIIHHHKFNPDEIDQGEHRFINFKFLSEIRLGIKGHNLYRVMIGLNNLSDEINTNSLCQKQKTQLINFIRADMFPFAVFKWIYKDEKDCLYAEYCGNTIPDDWRLFIPDKKTLGDILYDEFKIEAKTDSKNDPRLGFENSLVEILQGKENPQTFNNALAFCRVLPAGLINRGKEPNTFDSKIELCHALNIPGTDKAKAKTLDRYVDGLNKRDKIKFKFKKGKGYVIPSDLFEKAKDHFP